MQAKLLTVSMIKGRQSLNIFSKVTTAFNLLTWKVRSKSATDLSFPETYIETQSKDYNTAAVSPSSSVVMMSLSIVCR